MTAFNYVLNGVYCYALQRQRQLPAASGVQEALESRGALSGIACLFDFPHKILELALSPCNKQKEGFMWFISDLMDILTDL